MATISPARPTRPEPNGDQCVSLRGIGWKGYSSLLKHRGEKSCPQLIYLDGDLLLVSPSFSHERLAERLGQFISIVVEELGIPCVPAGRTTFRRRKKRGGVEGDKAYYLANEAKVRGKSEIKLRVDPPPDLVAEAVHTHDPSAAIEVYRRLRVPEVWVCEDGDLEILLLRRNGTYSTSNVSLAFPFLAASEIAPWLRRPQTVPETEWMRDVRQWVREIVEPRFRHRRVDPATEPPKDLDE